jgi:hypothetical protein
MAVPCRWTTVLKIHAGRYVHCALFDCVAADCQLPRQGLRVLVPVL